MGCRSIAIGRRNAGRCEDGVVPILELPHNPIPVYYLGGHQIRAYRGVGPEVGLVSPEDWVGSTTARPNGPVGPDGIASGLSVVADGRTVVSLLRADPASWVGTDLSDGDSGVLVKFLDPGERIPVHWHPDPVFARLHLGMAHGKAEAWVVLSDTARVWLGFAEGTSMGALRAAIDRQDGGWMLNRMHEFDLQRGDTVFVPPGLVHAIEAGSLLAEVQEPATTSILAEHDRFGLDGDRATLGAGWDAALGCLLAPSDRPGVAALVGTLPTTPGEHRPFPVEADRYFSSRVVEVAGGGGFPVDRLTVALVDGGRLTLEDLADGTVVVAREGSAWLLGATTGDVSVTGTGRLLLFAAPGGGTDQPD